MSAVTIQRPELVTLALWQTMIWENEALAASVTRARHAAVCDALARDGPAPPLADVARTYATVSRELEHQWLAGVSVDNGARVDRLLRLCAQM